MPNPAACEQCGDTEAVYPSQHAQICVKCRVADDKARLAAKAKKRRQVQQRAKARKKAKRLAHHRLFWFKHKRKKLRYWAKKNRDINVAKKAAKRAVEKAERQKRKEVTAQMLAEQELARRELARRDLLSFIKYFSPNYIAGWVHEDICLRLERFLRDVVDGKNPHLMLFMPPRHGKSMIVSENFPAWVLGQHPEFEFIATSYSSTLANKFSRRVQEKLRDPAYQNIFPGTTLSPNNQSIEQWGLAHRGIDTRGGYLAAGAGGPITGSGANVFVIDDPVKNREEAESSQIREALKGWFTSTAYTRMMPLSGMLMVLTRWHDDDLAGWQLREMEEGLKQAEKTGQAPDDLINWEVVLYPAIATQDEKFRKKGEALHEERFPLQRLNRIRKTLGPRDWAALYQQTPTAEEGAYFKKDKIRYYTGAAPLSRLDVYCAGDLAISKSESADYSVFLTVGIDEHEDVWVLEERRGRWDSNEIVDQIFDITQIWKPKRFGIEKGHISMAIGPLLDKRIVEEKRYDVSVEELPTGKRDKELRARPFQGRVAQGKVKWPHPNEALWVPEHINELLRFPNGVKDDRVDAAAWIGQMLMDVTYTGGPGGLRRKKRKSWKERLKKFAQGDRPNNSMAA